MNKREFVLGTGGACMAGLSSAARAGDQPVASGAATGSLADWQGAVGRRLADADGSGALVLQAVRPHAAVDARLQQYTLVFRAEGRQPAERGISRVLHRDDGRAMALYLEPSGHDATGHALWRADCSQRA
jgi:hypothetical protein